jgi:hypothetical protein
MSTRGQVIAHEDEYYEQAEDSLSSSDQTLMMTRDPSYMIPDTDLFLYPTEEESNA